MFHFPRLSSNAPMCSARDNAALPTLGFPIRASAGHWPFSASPRLIAAVHALHRLLVPRHPPCALTILTVIFGKSLAALPGDTRVIGYCAVFKVREEARRVSGCPGPGPADEPAARRSLKTQQHASRLGAGKWPSPCGLPDPVDIASGRPRSGERRGARELEATILPAAGALVEGLPRKEVIQPQLPLRLPCYDFTPVASPTFDGTLLKG